MSELKAVLEGISEGFEAFKTTNAERQTKAEAELTMLRERLEELEAKGNTPGGLAAGHDQAKRNYSVLHGPQGQKSFVIPSTGKLADVPELHAKSEISMDRWLRAMVFRDACEDKDALEFAAEHQQKSIGTGSTGVMVPDGFVPAWIDMARAQSVLMAAGAVTVTMNQKTLEYSHQTADPTAAWSSSEGGSLSATDPTFASRTLTAKTVALRTQVSLEATQDIPGFGAQITAAYTKALGAALDQAGIRGTSPAPTGLHSASGVGSVTSVGTPTNWDEVLDGVATFLLANNALDEVSGIIMHPNVWKVYAKLKTGISSDNTSLTMPPEIANVRRFVTTGADDVASPENYTVLLGNFKDLVMGVRMNPTIRILDGTTNMASNLLVEIIGVARIDFLPVRPASFVKLTGVTTS